MSLCRHELWLDHAAALELLTPVQRDVFESMVDGEPQELIAQRIGKSKTTVKRVYRDARSILQERLAGYEKYKYQKPQ